MTLNMNDEMIYSVRNTLTNDVLASGFQLNRIRENVILTFYVGSGAASKRTCFPTYTHTS